MPPENIKFRTQIWASLLLSCYSNPKSMLVRLTVIEILFIGHCALDSLWKTMPVPEFNNGES